MGQKVRLLHFADLHLGIESYGRVDPKTGLSTRVTEALEALDRVVEYAIDKGVDVVLFCGDAYKNQRPTQTHQREFAKRLKRLTERDITLVMVPGNHDAAVAGSALASTLDIFGTLLQGNVVVATKPQVSIVPTGHGREFPGLQIVCVPWPNPREVLGWAKEFGLAELPSDYRKVPLEEMAPVVAQATSALIEELGKSMVIDVPRVLAAHLAVEGTKLGSEQAMMMTRGVGTLSYQQLHPELFDYVALGHHHLAQEVGTEPPGAYAGSMLRVDFGEETETPKGFYVVDLEAGQPAEVEFVPVVARRFVTVDVKPNQEDPTAEVVRAVEKADVTDAIVRVIVRLSRAKAELLRDVEVQRALEPAHTVAYIKREIEEEARRRLPEGARWEDLQPMEALELYLKQKKTPGGRLRQLMTAAERLIAREGGQEGDEAVDEAGRS